jgi:hypothetical protein
MVLAPGTVRFEATRWVKSTAVRGTPIANLVAFYNEDVDLTVDGRLMERPGRAGQRVS